MKRTDSEIKQLVSDELKWDTRVKETDVGVGVDNGVVTLTGTVGSSFELLVVSEQLAGKSPVARQRLLLHLFAAELSSGALHALSIRAKTPAELAAPEST